MQFSFDDKRQSLLKWQVLCYYLVMALIFLALYFYNLLPSELVDTLHEGSSLET